MGVQAKIAEMEAGLAERNIPVAELCRQAKLAQTTWGRWKNGATSPRLDSWTDAEAAFAALIANSAHDPAPAQLHTDASPVAPAAPPQGAEKHIGQGLAEHGERHHATASVEDAA